MISAQANDSTGYIATGGVQYLKNNNISMHSEDLYISKKEIRVNYEFKNLSNKDITETVLFPMPAMPSFIDSDFADSNATYDTFEVWVNGQHIDPNFHVRTFMRPIIIENGEKTYSDKTVDTTELFKSCGVKESKMMGPWTSPKDTHYVDQQLLNCDNKEIDRFIMDRRYPDLSWNSQIIYSWPQTFKANAITKVKHTYAPLVGGSVHLGEEEFSKFCVDGSTRRGFHKSGARPYQALSYILTTGANWAKPIGKFKLTVERDPNELVSFCWKGNGKVKKVGPTTFEIKETNFVPTHDFD
ncbi:MAG: DUF4424 family protein, partial [Psychrobacter sp.]|nr:DUF4424 family protein [Psychrobacter sp.]